MKKPIKRPPNRRHLSETERFWDQVNKDIGEIHPILRTRCWLWTGSLIVGGYALFRTATDKKVLIHRHSFFLEFGEIDTGMEIDHLCRVRHCVNPHHLDLVTRIENCRRAGFHRRQERCMRGHLRTDDNLYLRNGRRQCKQCATIRTQNKRAKKRATLAVL